MTTLEISLLITCIVLALVFIVVRTLKTGLLAFLLKTLASFGFVASSIVALSLSSQEATIKLVMGLIAIGLLLGMIGDMILDLKVIYDNNDHYYLNAGMLSFALGHIAYFSAFTIWAQYLGITVLSPILITAGIAVVLTIGIMLSSKVLKLDFGKALWQTIVYTFILSFMTIYTLILAIQGGSWLVFVGLLLFFLSDIVLSQQYFGGKIKSKPLIAINHLLYYSAQIILLAFVFVI